MREMKFKAFHERWGWARPEDITVYGDGTYYVDYRGENGDKIETYDEKCKQLHIFQYIGLNDKNKRDIYQGDVVITHTSKNMVVGWCDRYASFVIERDGWAFKHYFGEALDPEECEVIGNVIENPELLKI